jgi:DNA-binding SARP family transcriptional activator
MTGAADQTAQVRFVLLDGVSAWRGRRPLRIGPPQRRAVLTALLLNAGRVMTTDQLVAAVWGSAAPEKAAATLHALISALRKALQPDLAPRERGDLIRTIDRGYLIDLADIDLDVLRFNAEIAEAGRASQRGDLGAARTALCAALDRCRGNALAAVPGPLAARHRCLLGRSRLVALENLVEIDLTIRPDQAPRHDLSGALAANPHRERLHALHIRLLAAAGRKAEALAAYTRIKQVLITDLGVEPGIELRRLHQQILAGDRPGPVHAPRVVPVARRGADDEQRPGAVPHQPVLLGRAGALAELAGELAAGMRPGPSVVLLHGMAGVGKTATAAWAAHRFAARWPDGRFFLSADADEAQRAAVRRAMGPASRCLLVLDDVTSDEQVRPMIPDNPACSVLLTSRYRGARLPHTGRVELTPLRQETVIELLAGAVGTVRVNQEPDALVRLIGATEGVPALVLSVAEALRARPGSSLAEFTDRLLGPTAGGSLELHLRALFDRCYTELDSVRAKVLRAAARQSELTGSTVAAATELPQGRVDALLIDLFDRGLLDQDGPDGYRFPPLVREYVLARAGDIEPLAEMCARVAKLTRHLVLDGARAATLVRAPHRPVLRGPKR